MGDWLSALWSLDGLFLLGDVIATAAMGWGIILETPEEPSPKQKVANRLVMFGVVAETLFSILLFVHDGSVSNQQQRKIIHLETLLAARSLPSDGSAAISSVLAKYSGQSFEIHTYDDDTEAADFTSELERSLTSAGWLKQEPPGPFGLGGVVAGVVVYVGVESSLPTKEAANALVGALKAKHIDAMVKAVEALPAKNRLNITVGIKPVRISALTARPLTDTDFRSFEG